MRVRKSFFGEVAAIQAFFQNLKLPKQLLVRIATGAVLILLAAFVTIFVRDSLNMRNPENALPDIYVYYKGKEAGVIFPAEHVERYEYTWRFLFWQPVSGGALDLESWRGIKPGLVDPASDIDIEFSFPPKEMKVYMATSESPFVEMPRDLYAPDYPATYTYKVEATWGNDRVVKYYFRIRIPTW